MKLWKKKTKNDEVIIMQPKSNGKAKTRDTPIDQSSVASKGSRSSSHSSIPSNPERKTSNPERDSASDNDDDDDDYSDSLIDDSDDELNSSVFDLGKKPEKPKKQLKPILNSCCGFCSLGAGSLITGLLYICLGIGFLVYRINDFNTQMGKSKQILDGRDYYKDIWKVMLVTGMAITGTSMLGALILLISSCVFGQKEHYSKMRVAVIIWCVLTALAVLWNIGEGVFVILLPAEYFPKLDNGIVMDRFDYKKIKSQLATIWALTALYTLFYVYLVIVLVSYLRQLKYIGAPKVGGTDSTAGNAGSRAVSRISNSRPQPGREVSSRASFAKPQIRSEEGRETPKSVDSATDSQPSISASDFREDGNTYVNWPHLDNDSAIGPSPVNETKNNDEEEETFQESSVYDLPPGDTYDGTFAQNNKSEVPTPLPKNNQEFESQEFGNTETSLSKGEGTSVKLTKDLLSSFSVRDDIQNQEAPSVIAESTYSTPRSKPVLKRLSSALLDPKPNTFNANNQKENKREEEKIEPKFQPQAVTNFFRKISEDTVTDNPMEEMFRLFGSDLCSKHPENCDRYLQSYKDVRSKSSQLSKLRDPYEFEKLGNNVDAMSMPIPMAMPQQFQSSLQQFDTNSIYSQDSAAILPPSARHLSHLSYKPRPEPVYDYRPRSRDERVSQKPSPRSHRQPRINHSNEFHSLRRDFSTLQNYRRFSDNHSLYSTFSQGYDPYYDDSCSSCYGDYIYGDYSDVYSFGSFNPPSAQQRQRPQQQRGRSYQQSYRSPPSYSDYDPIPSRVSRAKSSRNLSRSHFSEMTENKRRISKNSASTWIPVNSEGDYSIYSTNDDYFQRNKSRSLPNLADDSLPPRTISNSSNDTSFSNPLSPEFTLPSPHESNRLARSSSWSSFRHRSSNQTKEPQRSYRSNSRTFSNMTDQTSSRRNYSGYHTGDLRQKTSHTLRSERESWNGRNFPQSRNHSVNSSRRSRPSYSQKGRYHSRADSSRKYPSSFEPVYGHGRAPSRLMSSDSFSTYRPSEATSEFTYPSSRPSFKNFDRYQGKHVSRSHSRGTAPSRRDPSIDSSREIIPYRSHSKKPDFQSQKKTLHRSKSVRHSDHQRLSRTSSKQVKFGSTPDLRRI